MMKQQKLSLLLWVLVFWAVISIIALVLMVMHAQHAIQDIFENAHQVSGMAFSYSHPIQIMEKMNIINVSLLLLFILGILVGKYLLLNLIRGFQLQEMLLRSDLIKQKEAIIEAERKNMNKSVAFRKASHDVRTFLAGIIGLIDLCREDALENSELERNLAQMTLCASSLLGLINSDMDTSKVEEGKMQLAEEEFDVAEVVEESADMFHVVALQRGLEVIWDPCDCSVLRSSKVKGDCNRLKQILNNLLSNAVKFTSSGHIVIRTWSKKPSIEEFKHSDKHGCQFLKMFNLILKGLSKEKYINSEFGALNPIHHDSNTTEFIFEVDDTGLGIPKEKWESVFENYVQVNDTTQGGQGGTGLGLGIVRSFVRLMGGDIKIKDKVPDERGTCFRFNIFLKSDNPCPNIVGEETYPINMKVSDQMHMDNFSNTFSEDMRKCSKVWSSDRAMVFEKGVQVEGIHSLHFIQGDENRRVVHKWMVNLGIEVHEVNDSKLLSVALENIGNNISTSEKFDLRLTSVSLNSETSQDSIVYQDPLSDTDLQKTCSQHVSSSGNHSAAYVLVIIDLCCEDIPGVCCILKDFTKRISNNRYRVAWLVDASSSSDALRNYKHIPCDCILHKPLHGSRLYELLKLLQSFGVENESQSSEIKSEDKLRVARQFTEAISSMATEKVLLESTYNESICQRAPSRYNENYSRPLSDMNILLVEDEEILRHIESILLSNLGASVESADNGLDALNIVKKAFREATHAEDGSIKEPHEKFPYNLILMDCEMPIMDGYEATRAIRDAEQLYGYRVPIIALTAHAASEERKKTYLAGMDFHLTKPLQEDMLLEAIRTVCQK